MRNAIAQRGTTMSFIVDPRQPSAPHVSHAQIRKASAAPC